MNLEACAEDAFRKSGSEQQQGGRCTSVSMGSEEIPCGSGTGKRREFLAEAVRFSFNLLSIC